MIQEPLYILAFLCLLVAAAEWLCRKTVLKHLSSSLVVIILGAIFANFGLIPSASNASPVYDGIFICGPAEYLLSVAGVSLKNLKKAGVSMLIMFFVGSLATMVGVLVALQLVSVEEVFGDSYKAIAGMMTGTYIGGSVNFNAVALHYDVVREGATYTGVVVADNIVTAVWMIVTLSLPKLMSRFRPNPELKSTGASTTDIEVNDREKLDPLQLGLLLALGIAVLLVSNEFSGWLKSRDIDFPSILLLTTIALILAQIKSIQKLPGAKLLGMFSVYLFLSVVGAFCEITALADVGEHAIGILVFTVAIVLVHGAILLAVGWFFKTDWALIAIASQANIGGGSTALALAKSFKRNDLLLPAILAGSLGSGVGTYFGFLVAGLL